MTVSIIVPVYKVEEYLPKCINSVINQTYSDFELILVNDGSPDNSGKICDEYAKKDSRIKVIHKENGGLVSAVRMGIKEATGDYITFLDSDDWLEPQYIETLYNAIHKNDCDMAMCDYIKSYPDKKINCNSCAFKEGLYTKADITKDILPFIITAPDKTESVLMTHSRVFKIFKRELLLNNLKYYYEDIRLGEDFLITLSCLCDCGKIYYAKDAFLYNYRFNSNSLTHSYNSNYFKEYYMLSGYLGGILKSKNIKDNDQIYYLYINCFINAVNFISYAFSSYKKADILKEIKKALNSDEFTSFKTDKNLPLNKKQSFYMFLMKNKLYFLLYLLQYYFYLKRKWC